MFAPLAIIAIFNFGTAEAERWLTAECAAHHIQLETLRAGAWPDSPSGRKIAALADRLGPETAKRIRRYWELQAWLVVQAEEVMMEEAAGDATFDPEQIHAAIAELGGLKRALGKSTYAAVKALLPFSRKHESEADHIGIILMAAAGYDPRESIHFWERMGKMGGKTPPEFQSTHPSSEHRAHDLQGWLKEAMPLYNKSSMQTNRPLPNR